MYCWCVNWITNTEFLAPGACWVIVPLGKKINRNIIISFMLSLKLNSNNTMKKLSVFVMAAALAGLFELAAAQGDQNNSNNKAVFASADKVIAKNDTLPAKKKRNKKHTDTMQMPAPTPTPAPTPAPNPTPAPSPNPPVPNPNPPVPSPTPTPSPNPPAPTPPTTTPTTPTPSKTPPNH